MRGGDGEFRTFAVGFSVDSADLETTYPHGLLNSLVTFAHDLEQGGKKKKKSK